MLHGVGVAMPVVSLEARSAILPLAFLSTLTDPVRHACVHLQAMRQSYEAYLTQRQASVLTAERAVVAGNTSMQAAPALFNASLWLQQVGGEGRGSRAARRQRAFWSQGRVQVMGVACNGGFCYLHVGLTRVLPL